MQFVVLKENLSKALQVVSRNISIRPQLPVLSNIIMKVHKNILDISATNLEMGITYSLNVKEKKEGEVAVPGKLLTEFVTNISADKIEFTLDGNTLKAQTEKTKANFTTSSFHDFPPFPEVERTKRKISLKKIKEAVLRTVFAASTDETRPVLTGVKTVIKNGSMKLVATDGYRLSIDEVKNLEEKEAIELILPARTLSELVKISSEHSEEEVGFSVVKDKSQVVFFLPKIKLYTRLIEGEFPNIEKIIPDEFKTRALVDKDSLAKSVKIASIFAKDAANIVKIKVTDKGMWLSANSPQVGENRDFLEADVEGESVEIAFNYRFLLDLLANFPDDEVVFEASGSLNPGVFRPKSKKSSFFHIIMPVRVQD